VSFRKRSQNHQILVVLFMNNKKKHYLHYSLSFEMRPHYVAQTGLKLVDSSDPPASASQVAGTTRVCHHTWLIMKYFRPHGSSEKGLGYLGSPGLTVLKWFSSVYWSMGKKMVEPKLGNWILLPWLIIPESEKLRSKSHFFGKACLLALMVAFLVYFENEIILYFLCSTPG
jgi:hypothetical protein